MKILIIDDDVNTREVLGEILESKGFEIKTAATGPKAVDYCRSEFFNVVLSDLRLSGLNGLDVLKFVREISEDTMVIMMTGYASIESSIEAMNKGAYSYVVKPVDIDNLLHIIDKALEKQRLAIENKRLLEELKISNEKLKELDKLKSAFVANVSHEFKNPLAVINGSLSVMLSGRMGKIDPKQKEMLEMGKRNIDRLLRLVTDILDISRIESGKMEMKMENFDMDLLVGEILKIYEGEFSNKKILFSKEISERPCKIYADKDKISEVLINLLSNAVKYTPEGGNIKVSLKEAQEDICFEISDTGPGIPKEYFEKIFDKFERIAADKQEGTGLGLSIAKDIIELHKGKIWVESGIGKGSKFIFTLPLY